MKKKLHTSLLFFFLLVFIKSNAQQVLYQNDNLGSRIYNPGFGAGDTPKVIFDDINFPSTLAGTADSVVISGVRVAIGRAPGSPAVVVNVYAAAPDSAYDSLNSLPAVPPKLIGTLNLPANGTSNYFTVGDDVTPLAAFKLDTGRFLKGYQTLYIGLSFSDSVQSNIGWYLSNGGDTNYDLIYKYNVTDKDTPVTALNLSGTYNLPATFDVVVNGTFKTATVLAVSINSFEVSKLNDGNQLKWQTQSESNSNYFLIERSSDGQHFQSIGKVAAAGFSNKALNYQFIDATPASGVNYYRLHLVDKDNANTYSNIKSIGSQLKPSLTIYPNPAVTGNFKVGFTAANAGLATLQIKTMNGQIIYSKKINIVQGVNSVSVPDAHLSSGVYYINVLNSEMKYIGKLQKQ